MGELRTTWTAQQAQEEVAGREGASSPEAQTVDRSAPQGASSGEDHRAGTEEMAATSPQAQEDSRQPPDPRPVGGEHPEVTSR